MGSYHLTVIGLFVGPVVPSNHFSFNESASITSQPWVFLKGKDDNCKILITLQKVVRQSHFSTLLG